jgi:hypothetical protein
MGGFVQDAPSPESTRRALPRHAIDVATFDPQAAEELETALGLEPRTC